MKSGILTMLVKCLDPKLEKFRDHSEENKYAPKTTEEFIELIKRTPKKVLSDRQRGAIAAAMTFDFRKVKDIMLKKEDIVFVNKKEILGPLMLDKLYQSGLDHFPVIDQSGKIVGVIHTDKLNSLEKKESEIAEKYMTAEVFSINENTSLMSALEKFFDEETFYLTVTGNNGELVGALTLDMIIAYLLS